MGGKTIRDGPEALAATGRGLSLFNFHLRRTIVSSWWLQQVSLGSMITILHCHVRGLEVMFPFKNTQDPLLLYALLVQPFYNMATLRPLWIVEVGSSWACRSLRLYKTSSRL